MACEVDSTRSLDSRLAMDSRLAIGSCSVTGGDLGGTATQSDEGCDSSADTHESNADVASSKVASTRFSTLALLRAVRDPDAFDLRGVRFRFGFGVVSDSLDERSASLETAAIEGLHSADAGGLLTALTVLEVLRVRLDLPVFLAMFLGFVFCSRVTIHPSTSTPSLSDC